MKKMGRKPLSFKFDGRIYKIFKQAETREGVTKIKIYREEKNGRLVQATGTEMIEVGQAFEAALEQRKQDRIFNSMISPARRVS